MFSATSGSSAATAATIALIVGLCLWRPSLAGKRATVSWSERVAALPHLLPPLAIFALVIGVIYGGIAIASESAALGVVALGYDPVWFGVLLLAAPQLALWLPGQMATL